MSELFGVRQKMESRFVLDLTELFIILKTFYFFTSVCYICEANKHFFIECFSHLSLLILN